MIIITVLGRKHLRTNDVQIIFCVLIYALDQVVYTYTDVCVVMLQCPLFCRVYPKYKRKSGRFSIVSTHSFEGSTPSPYFPNPTPMYPVVDKSKKVQGTAMYNNFEYAFNSYLSFSITIVPTLFILIHWWVLPTLV